MRVFEFDLGNLSNYETCNGTVIVEDHHDERHAKMLLTSRYPQLSIDEYGLVTNGRATSDLHEITREQVKLVSHSG